MTRKSFAGDEKGQGGFTPDDINTGFFGAALQAGKEGFGARKDAVGDKIGSIPLVGGFLNQRRMLSNAKKKQKKRRDKILNMYNSIAETDEFKSGAHAFETSIRKSVQDYNDDVLIDVLIQMGLTSKGEIESTLKLFSSGEYKLSNLQSEIENAASEAGVSTKTGKLGLSLKAKGVSSIGSGADVSPSSSTSGEGSGVESRLVLQELSTQTSMLSNIEIY